MSNVGSRVSQVEVSRSSREIVLGTARAGALRTGHRRGLLRNADDASNDERKLSPAWADVERELERRGGRFPKTITRAPEKSGRETFSIPYSEIRVDLLDDWRVASSSATQSDSIAKLHPVTAPDAPRLNDVGISIASPTGFGRSYAMRSSSRARSRTWP